MENSPMRTQQQSRKRVISLLNAPEHEKNTMNQTTPGLFQYGRIIHRPTQYAGVILTHGFFCQDGDTATVISRLNKTIVSPEWDEECRPVWFNTEADRCVSKTPDGWLAHRVNDQTIVHELYLLPILFPTA